MKNFKKGFTLIELLVVVAIIGILASVVLASLNTARAKGADAAIKANMANIRAQAELYYDGTGAGKYAAADADTCSGMFTADTVIAAAIAQINTQAGGTAKCGIGSSGQKWALQSSLKTTGTTWCVDNSGWAKAGTAITGGVCS
jgi:prepilin-type N-terminal cleavage/methylation domain-containing protein